MAGRQPRSGSPPRRRGRSKGQALVEFALIAPIFFVVFFGIVEFSFILTALGGYNFAAREGARWGSIIGRTEPNPQADSEIIKAVLNHTSALPFGTPLSIDIYKSDQSGNCVSITTPIPPYIVVPVGTFGCTEDQYLCKSSSDCYTPMGLPNWPPTSRNDSFLGADYLGVRVLYQYTFVTSFLNFYCDPKQTTCSSSDVGNAGTHLNLSATSVQRIEPQDYGGGDVPSTAPLATSGVPWPIAASAWFWQTLIAPWEGAPA